MATPDKIAVIHNWADCTALAPGPKDNTFTRGHGLTGGRGAKACPAHPSGRFSIEFCVERPACGWNEEGMSWPPVAAE